MLNRAGMGEKEINAILEKRKKRFLERIAGKP
jgi:tRNA A22 N-methylase